jgi:dTDP-glucose 4,6-dehydratase
MTEVLVTGGAGFIGSNFVHYALATRPDWRVTTLDKLTYAGRLENLKGALDDPRHSFVRGDITDAAVAGCLVERADLVVHFAAETHVDRAIHGAADFIKTGGSSRSRPTRCTGPCRTDPAARPMN